MKFLSVKLACGLSLFLSYIAFAIDPSVDKQDESMPMVLVDDYFNFVSDLSFITYDGFAELLARKAKQSHAFAELFDLASRGEILENGLVINYPAPWLDFVDSSKEELLFHGTKATLDILASQNLHAYNSKSGFGIFFGRNLNVAYEYCEGTASNIHQTYSLGLTRSVLVLSKDPAARFIRNDAGWLETTKEYIYKQDTYSLDKLKYIIFSTREDVDRFAEFFDQQAPEAQQTLRRIGLYNMSYLPLRTNKNLTAFQEALLKNQVTLFRDIDFVGYPVGRRDSSISYPALMSRLTDLSLESLQAENTALYLAAINNDDASMRQIINRLSPRKLALDFMAKNERVGISEKKTPFNGAIIRGHYKILKMLFEALVSEEDLAILAAGVEPHIINEALKKGSVDSVMLLAQYLKNFPRSLSVIAGAALDLEDKALAWAIFEPMLAGAPMLLEQDFDGYDGSLALKALKRQHFEALKLIVATSPKSLTFTDENGDFPLLEAAKTDLQIFTMILDAAPEMLRNRNNSRENVAHVACGKGSSEIIALIAEKAPELFLWTDYNEGTPLHNAARSNTDFSILAQKFPLALRMKDGWKSTPAATAANQGHKQIVEFLLEKYPDEVLSDIDMVVKRAAIHCPEVLGELAKKYEGNFLELLEKNKCKEFIPLEILNTLAL